MKKGSLRLRLFVAAALSIAAALTLTGIAIIRLFEDQVRERVLGTLENDLLQLAGSVQVGADGTLSLSRPLSDPRYEEPFGGRYWIIGLQPVPGAPATEPLRSRSLWDAEFDPANPVGPEGDQLVSVRRDLSLDRDGVAVPLYLLTAAHEEEIQRPMNELRDQLVVALGVIGVVLALGAWVQVTVGLRPLEQLRAQLAAIRSGATQRLSGSYPDEVSPLVNELNDVLDLRDTSLERARRRAGDLAHGLRTPLTVLSAVARDLRKAGQAGAAVEIESQSDAMLKHVDRALARARLSSGRGHGATELKPAVERVLKAVQRLAGADDLAFVQDIPADARVQIEQGDLTELLGNLLDNARKWARSEVAVSFREGHLVVEDDGPGVADGDLDMITERGRRLDESKQGSGLGLSIVRDIADIYGLTVAFGRSGLGGLRVDIGL